MKKTLLILAISALTLSLNAYVPMLQNGNTWTYLNWSEYKESGIVSYGTVSFAILGDSVFNDMTYYKSDFSKWLFREDTTLQKVFIYNPTDDIEGVLYDFSLNAGDSADICYDFAKTVDGLSVRQDGLIDSAYCCKIHIDAVDTLTDIDGRKLRLYHYHVYNKQLKKEIEGCYAERYGSLDNILNLYISHANSESNSYSLRCFVNSDGETEYKGSEWIDEYLGEDCNGNGVISSIVSVEVPSATIAYARGVLNINADNIDKVEIFTAAGVMVSCYQSSEINISLSPGIYFARISANGRVSTERFIVK